MRAPPALLVLLGLAIVACQDAPPDGAEAGQDGGVAAAPGADTIGVDTADAAASRDGRDGTTIRVAGRPITVEVADAPEERERGLMDRDSLPEDHGMLFVYGEERRLSFWMRNTRIPLDIAFIDRGGTIIDIQRMEPETDEYYTSAGPAMYALEMPRGWFERNGVSEGDRVSF